MTYLALVGVPRTAYTLQEAVMQARLRGYEVALVDAAAGLAIVPSTLPVSRLVEVDRLMPDTVADALTAIAPEQVLSFSELHLGLAARVRERLGVAGEPSAVEDLVRDKAATRRRLLECGLSGVRCAVTTLNELPSATADFSTPFVVKPLDMTGSIGVRAIQSRDDIRSYPELFADLGAEEHRERRLLVEEFLHGTEYSVEGISVEGAFHLLAVTEKETSGFPSFYETGHLLPARAQHTDSRFGPYVQEVITALGIGTAPIHAEVKVTPDAIDLIEIHTRFGGDLIPLLMERALGIKAFGQFYDALQSGHEPRLAPSQSRVAGVRFVGEAVVGVGLQVPALPPGVEAEAVLRGPDGRDPSALDNIRILNRRHGHILFTAPEHEAAEKFVALMGNDGKAIS
jgi:predicted ATP-grasp superfamily ATP-dependent carboligase